MEESSILSAKFGCPVARQDISLSTAHDCETGVQLFLSPNDYFLTHLNPLWHKLLYI